MSVVLMPYALMKAGNDAYEANACSQSLLKVPGVAAYKKDTVASVSRSTKAGQTEGFTVLTKDGTSMDADAVVCATGFTIPVLKPLTGQAWDARKEQIAELRLALKGAMTVVIAGSGPAGINTAGEVRNNVDIDSGCKIHLICTAKLADLSLSPSLPLSLSLSLSPPPTPLPSPLPPSALLRTATATLSARRPVLKLAHHCAG